MKKSINLLTGTLITVFIFGLSAMVSHSVPLPKSFVPNSFFTHSIMLIFSLSLILYFKKKNIIQFPLNRVKVKYYLYAFLITLLAELVLNILATVILKLMGMDIDPSGKGHAVVSGFNSIQFFLFIFLYASISEEFLFRGLAQNYFAPWINKGFHLGKKIFISIPVLLCGLFFGAAHLILLTSETSGPVIFRVVLTTLFVGIIAGYFQERHKSIIPAIVVHMTANLPGLIMSFFL